MLKIYKGKVIVHYSSLNHKQPIISVHTIFYQKTITFVNHLNSGILKDYGHICFSHTVLKQNQLLHGSDMVRIAN